MIFHWEFFLIALVPDKSTNCITLDEDMTGNLPTPGYTSTRVSMIAGLA